MEHSLKCWPHEHDAIGRGEKTFEVRSNQDRSFGVGDILFLRRWDPAARHTPSSSQGCYIHERGWTAESRLDAHTHRARVTYVLHGGRFGLPEGICVMSIKLDDPNAD